MRKLVDYINRKKLRFAIGNVALSVVFVFMPLYFSGYISLFSEVFVLALFAANGFAIIELTALLVFAVISIAVIMISAVLCLIFIKFNITLVLPPLIIALTVLINPLGFYLMAGPTYMPPSVFILLPVLIFAIYLTYFVADLRFKAKDRGRAQPPEEKNLSDNERIALPEQQIQDLKKDD